MPELIDLHHKYREDKRVAIIAFHDASVATLSELDAKLVKVREEHWNGRPLPFPILLDKTGATIRDFGIRAYPTMLLLDPEGKLVARGETVFDQQGTLLADGPLELVTKVLDGRLRVDPNTGRLAKTTGVQGE